MARLEQLDQLKPFRQDRLRTGFFLDFDGTLAPVVLEPAAARPLPAVPDLLEDLAASYGLVAIVSGRRAPDLLDRLGVAGPRLVGLYGAEEIIGGVLRQPREATAWRATASVLAGQAAELIVATGLVGCEVELKDMALSIHYRKAVPAEPPPALLQWARSAAPAAGFQWGIGRMVMELKPSGISKAGTIERLIKELGLANAVLAGDDTADVEAMARAKEIVPSRLLRIGVRSPEQPEPLAQNSDIEVVAAASVVSLLQCCV